MIRRFIIIVALLSTALMAAQEGTTSPYSYYGIGLTKFKGTVENQSMGGILTFSDSIHLNLRNPASYGKLKLTTYAVGGSHQRMQLENAGGDTESNSTTSLDYLAIGIPTGKFNFGLGIMPYSSVGYNIRNINNETANTFTGRGGMNKVFLTTAYAFNNNLSLGVDVNYNFGNIQNNFVVFQEGIQYGTRRIDRTNFSGFNLNFGIDYQAKISNSLKLHTAATYAPEMNISTETSRSTVPVTFISGGTEQMAPGYEVTTLNLPESEIRLPAQLTLGAGLGGVNTWFLGAEYTHIQEAGYNLNEGPANLTARYETAAQYRLGGYFIPQYNSQSYWERIVYRAGARYEETGLYLNNEGIDEFGISFGLGLPAGNTFSSANIGIEYGQRGTTNSGLIKENFFKLSISLSLNDQWFQQRRFD